MRSFHDFNIFEYTVNCQLKEITLKLKEHHGNSEGTVIFSGVIGHLFENVLEGNIVLEFAELEAPQFYKEFEKSILHYQKWGLPMLFKSEIEFLSESQQKNLKFISISTSYGLSGWVICTTVTINA
jgi:fatty acid/phospholipid biosynthesis enzyme